MFDSRTVIGEAYLCTLAARVVQDLSHLDECEDCGLWFVDMDRRCKIFFDKSEEFFDLRTDFMFL